MGTFTDSELTDIRRHCGYGMFGKDAVQAFGFRFFQHYGTLEYRVANMQPSEETVVRQYLTDLATLEAAVPAATKNMDTDQAAVWFHNKNEVRDRLALLDAWRTRLVQFVGVPPGPALRGSSSGSVRMVV